MYTRAPSGYRCGEAGAWPMTPAVTEMPVPCRRAETFSPVSACRADALGGPGQTRKAELA